MKLLIETAYLPPVSWFALAIEAKTVALELCETYHKGSLRNRCHIAGPNGVQALSIPLRKGKHEKMPIQSVQIAYDEPWQRTHWRTLKTAYGNAPYFMYYEDKLAHLYEKRVDFLVDWNRLMLDFLIENGGLPIELGHSEHFQAKDPILPNDYRDQAIMLKLPTENWFAPVKYPQVFTEKHGFLPNLSMLDLFLCCGKQCGQIAKNSLNTEFTFFKS